MSRKLASEIRQSKPFESIEEEGWLNLVRTHEVMSKRGAEFLKPYQLTPTQYNILRILRGAGKDGITCSQAAERMLTADPDITRLIDRLVARGLAERERSEQDRRVVITRITDAGLALLKTMDKPVTEFHKRQFGSLGKQQIEQFIETLEALRE